MPSTDHLMIWDFDGTLGYRQGMWVYTMRQVLLAHDPDMPFSEDAVRAKMRPLDPYMFHYWETPHTELNTADAWWEAQSQLMAPALVDLGYPTDLAMDLARRFRELYVDLKPWRLFEDTLTTLAAFDAAGWTQVLLSNHVPELPSILAHLGLGNAFAQVYNSAVTGYEKPHPRAMAMVLEDWSPGTAWMVGDNPHADMLAARQAGIEGILVRVARDGYEGTYSEDLAGVLEIVRQTTGSL